MPSRSGAGGTMVMVHGRHSRTAFFEGFDGRNAVGMAGAIIFNHLPALAVELAEGRLVGLRFIVTGFFNGRAVFQGGDTSDQRIAPARFEAEATSQNFSGGWIKDHSLGRCAQRAIGLGYRDAGPPLQRSSRSGNRFQESVGKRFAALQGLHGGAIRFT